MTEAQEDCEVCVICDVPEIPSGVVLWRLVANRSVVTEAMIEILEVACSKNNESYQKASDSKRND